MPGTETAGGYHAETTLPARSPVRNRYREPRKTPGFQRLDRRTPAHPDWLAGAGGFEPPYGGIKIRCLTTWLRPTKNRSSGRASASELRRHSSLIWWYQP